MFCKELEVKEERFHAHGIHDVIAAKSIFTVFHPICSIARQEILGFECLSRGNWKTTEVNPYQLFTAAGEYGCLLELDRLCREKAILTFKEKFDILEDKLLFLNIDTSILTATNVGSNSFLDLVERAGLHPNKIVIEVLESRSDDEKALQTFVDRYRGMGFNIALDDVGMGNSNLNRIAQLRPDVVKIDRYLVNGMHFEVYKRAVFRGLVEIAHQVGAIVVAEGVENENDALACLEEGADCIQGFFFCTPGADVNTLKTECKSKLEALSDSFRSFIINIINSKRVRTSEQLAVFTCLAECLESGSSLSQLSDFSEQIQKENCTLQCFYILNETGVQISPTLGIDSETGSRIFRPAQEGCDHSMKRYYLSLASGLKRYISDPYLSCASGTVCQTLSAYVNWTGKRCILCADFSH